MDINVVPKTLAPEPAIPDLRTSDGPERMLGLLVLLAGLGGFGVWAAFAPIDSAAVAPGVVTVESSRKTVQHLEGGIVSEILVREGDAVQKGAVLLRIDDTESRAQLEIARGKFLARRAEEARLIAERDGAEKVAFPEDLLAAKDDPRVEEAMTGQERVFQARHQAMAGEVGVLGQRVEQLEEQIRGLESLAASKAKRIGLYQEEIDGLKSLFAKGLGDKSRLREWERLAAELEGERAEHLSSIAASRVKIGETQLQIAQVRRVFTSEVVEQLRADQTELSDLRERMRALESALDRTVVLAPTSGAVVGMKIHTVGGVLRPGDPILDLIPEGEPLIVETRVQPQDIDQVIPGLKAEIRFSAFNARVTPTVFGTVQTISGDRLTDPQTGMPYYLARIQVTPEGMETLRGLTLLPGMPADVMIKTGERTFFEYLIRPITDRIALGLKEE
ncbi:HlyD family type I secretion periplasmic adaptor subunit [Thiocystis violascens]|uniref:Membrane fusion protein (MFP) family protein n=1 Tax=Thiocystis violascens (strain ATCC 17096 / DSM 198 / 6111) TaxID=765911 RepID=I3YA79_THIV6|nr:HlyD family type I secretion periplasmic adaptor subunit [Thiocystis violascens]AFL73897.1 type I secretion membrane fusion protein, HlyD family [Thiocystis violascens DSM 198]